MEELSDENPLNTNLRTDMYGYLFIILSCFCICPGLYAEQCSKTVLAKRHTVYVPEGGSVSLSCVVQHCGKDNWIGGWIWKEDKFSLLKPTLRRHLSNLTLSANQTRLFVKFLNVNQSDQGSYGCRVTWDQGFSDQGHMTYVNITAAVPRERSVLYRILVCVGASVCFPIILGLAYCLSSEVKPQPLPRTLSINYRQPKATHISQPCQAPKPPPRCQTPQKKNSSTHEATPKPKPKKELVYAALSQDALGQQRANPDPAQTTVYSALKFS